MVIGGRHAVLYKPFKDLYCKGPEEDFKKLFEFFITITSPGIGSRGNFFQMQLPHITNS